MAKRISELTNIETINMLRASNPILGERIPQATVTNIEAVGESILNYPTTRNEFLTTLTNQVSLTLFYTTTWENKLKVFKRGKLAYGKSIEQIFVDIVKGKDFSDNFANDKVGSLVSAEKMDNVSVRYITENARLKYKVTISEEQLRGAFRDEKGLGMMVAQQLQVPIRSSNFDEYILTMGLVDNAKYKEIQTVMPVDEASGKSFTKQVATLCEKLTFLSTNYNQAGVHTFTDLSKQVIITTPEVKASLNVDVLAVAYNMSKTELLARIITVDEFADPNRIAILCDEDFIQVWDTQIHSKVFENGDGLFTNSFLHVWQIYAQCDFANAIDLRTELTPVRESKTDKVEKIKDAARNYDVTVEEKELSK